jgi:hypothetical protein
MTLLMCLNECSYIETNATTAEIATALDQFAGVLRAIRQHRTDTALVAESSFSRLMIGDGVAFAKWQADGRNREVMRFLKSQLTRAPFSSVLDADLSASTEYTHNGVNVVGLAAAHLLHGLAVSLTLKDGWDSSYIDLLCQVLTDDDGEVELLQSVERVCHASTMPHVAEHRQWLIDAGTNDVRTGQALWDVRADIFPHLRFLPRVRGDLVSLQPVWVRSVTKMLMAFEKTIATWDRSRGIAPVWPTKVTPEHEKRKALCYFEDPEDGCTMLFDTHARFTPWVGRMHFRWDTGSEKLVVAYIGEKLS